MLAKVESRGRVEFGRPIGGDAVDLESSGSPGGSRSSLPRSVPAPSSLVFVRLQRPLRTDSYDSSSIIPLGLVALNCMISLHVLPATSALSSPSIP